MSAPADLWRAVFGNPHPVEIEIGPGRGEVLLAFAARHPAINFLGIEHAAGLATAVTAAAAARGLANVRVLAGDARCIVARLVPADSVAAVHVYFPDPWPKTHHRHRRLWGEPALAQAIARVLLPGGRVHVVSDLDWLCRQMRERLRAAGLVEIAASVPPRPLSKFERGYAAAGVHTATFSKPA